MTPTGENLIPHPTEEQIRAAVNDLPTYTKGIRIMNAAEIKQFRKKEAERKPFKTN